MGSICNQLPSNQPGFDKKLNSSSFLMPLQDLRATTSSSNILKNSNSHLNGSALILGCKKDQNLAYLNKYMLLFMYFIEKKNSDIENEICNFIKILKTIDQEKAHLEIQDFCKQYKVQKNSQQRQNFLIHQFFKNKLFSSAIQKFPTLSQDPRIFGYIQRPFIDIYKGIKSKYVIKKKRKNIFCVVQMRKTQFDVLQKISQQKDQNFFTFSTFLRCYSDQDKAKQRQRQLLKVGQDLTKSQGIQSITVFFYICFPNQDNDKSYDHGFYIAQDQKDNEFGDIVMNIRNYFKIVDSDIKQKTFTLNYNALGRLIHMSRQRKLQIIPKLLLTNDLIQSKNLQINSQSSLIRVIGQRNISLSTSQTTIKQTNQKNIQNVQRLNLIQLFIQQNKFEQALAQYKKAIILQNQSIQFRVKQAKIYYQWKKYDKVDEILKSIQIKKQELKKEYFDQYYLYEFMSVKRLLAKGSKKKAKERILKFKEQMIIKYQGLYDFKGRQIQQFLIQLQPFSANNNQRIDWNDYSVGINLGITLSH